jgi:hypothetical protein
VLYLDHTETPMEKSLQTLCRLYWGRGNVGRNSLYHHSISMVEAPGSNTLTSAGEMLYQHSTSVAHDSDGGASTSASPAQIFMESAVGGVDISMADSARIDSDDDMDGRESTEPGSEAVPKLFEYTYLELEEDLAPFLRGFRKILVREEYVGLHKLIETVRSGRSGGVVILGQPGIGKLPPFLLAPSVVNVIIIL